MNARQITPIVAAVLGACVLTGCQSGETIEQDTEIRTRSDGTRVKEEEKTETKKVDRRDDDD